MENKKNIAILIRTYSRISDTEALIHIIKTKWPKHNYTIFVVHNGENDGYLATEYIKKNSYYIQVKENTGHRTGAASLVKEGFNVLKTQENFSHYIFIESDFWLLNDNLIDNYLRKTDKNKTKIAATIWVEKIRSIAVDFFIADAEYLKKNSQLLDWDNHAEQYVAKHLPYEELTIIDELRPTHLPRLARCLNLSIQLVDGGRFRIFPKAPALTHHIETLDPDKEKAIQIKKGLANSLAKTKIFPAIQDIPTPPKLYLQYFSKFIPQSWWIKYIKKHMTSFCHKDFARF